MFLSDRILIKFPGFQNYAKGPSTLPFNFFLSNYRIAVDSRVQKRRENHSSLVFCGNNVFSACFQFKHVRGSKGSPIEKTEMSKIQCKVRVMSLLLNLFHIATFLR